MSSPMEFERNWKESRSGARAGAGFRFQDAATVFALALCWRGEIAADAATPESLDDVALEGSGATIWVQAKSKIDQKARFRAREISDIILAGPGADHDARIIFLDRSFLGFENRDWGHSISDQPDLVAALTDAVGDDPVKQAQLITRLQRSTVFNVPAPMIEAAALIADKMGIGEGAATLCARDLLHQVGLSASENARCDFKTRRSINVGDVEAICSRVLDLIDPATIDRAFRLGLAQFIDFHQPLEDPRFYEGVSTRPGHVAAGLVQPRDEDVDAVVEPLLSGRHVLVAGPSGSGKSALCYLAAFETRHALRWIEAASMTEADRPIFLRGLKAQAPTTERPIVVYVDDVGRGGDTIWAWLVDQARRMPALRVVGSVREEDLGVLSALDQVSIERPKLSEPLAQRIWTRLCEAGATKVAYWKEAFELSGGLLLEFTHILTQGGRLQDVVFEQVRRRVQEGREDELALLPVAASAAMYGASVARTSLLAAAKMNEAQFSAAFLRLRNEHLVGAEHEGRISGLHELRSREILNACCSLRVLDRSDIASCAFRCVVSADARRFAARAVRDGAMNDVALIQAAAVRLREEPDSSLLTAVLEALRLVAFDVDAETFKRVADEINLSHREYALAMLFLNVDLAEGLAGSSAVFDSLTKLTKQFQAERAPDRRPDFLRQVSSTTMAEAAEGLDTPEAVRAILTALHGLTISEMARPILEQAREVMLTADIDEVAEFLAILHESDPDSVEQAIDRLGGSSALLERLWRETSWAIKPETLSRGDGTMELRADLLAVGDELNAIPDSIVFNYAARAAQLCPEAATVTSRPLQLSGEVIEINGFCPGVKELNRRSIHSKASIAWNRMLIHAVAQKYGATSRTEVLERHRYGVTQAAAQLARAADLLCRRRRFQRPHIHEAQALEVLEDLTSPPPIGRPEDMLDNPLGGEIGDPVGALIVAVAQAIQKTAKGELTGVQLVLEMESVKNAVEPAEALEDWKYAEGPPVDALKEIKCTAGALRRVGLAVGSKRVTASSVLLPSHKLCSQGKGLERALQRVDARWAKRWFERKKEVEEKFGAAAFAAPAQGEEGLVWPDWEVCLLIDSDTLVGFIVWVKENLEALRTFSESCVVLAVAPRIDDVIAPQVAMRVTKYANLPDLEFESQWRSRLSEMKWHVSDLVKQLRIAQDAMVSLYAAQFHLDGREFLVPELEQLQSWKEEAENALGIIQDSAEADVNGPAAVAEEYIVNFLRSLADGAGECGGGAVAFARAAHGALMAGEEDERVIESAFVVIAILEAELEVA